MWNNQKIPEGWSVKKLGDICLLTSGGTPSKATISYWKNGNIKWLSAKHIEDDKIVGCEYITKEAVDNSASKLTKKGDIILVTRVSVGKIILCEEEFAVNQDLTIISSKQDLPNFLFYSLKDKTQIIVNKSQGLAIKGITKDELKELNLLLPPLPEQEKIAEILGTWDKAIEKLSHLIEQKKLLKKGLMQRLLTGKVRLFKTSQGARKYERFSQPWKDYELSELLDYEQPTQYIVHNILKYETKKIPVLTANKSFILGSTDDRLGIYVRGECIIFDDFTTDTKYVNFPFKLKSSAIKILTNKKCVNLKFIYNKMKLLKYPLGGHKRYYLSEYQYITISIPDLSEQQAIADVLTKADEEIDLLNKKLTLFKEQKKGLMQQLLTGNIRVKVD